MTPNADLVKLAVAVARQYGLDPVMVCAVVDQESGWNNWAMRYEPLFFSRYIQPLVNAGTVRAATEGIARATSWGLMQVMGQVAREFGFKGQFLSQLCEAGTGLEVGCQVLRRYLDDKGGDWNKALLRYNGGGRPEYATEVFDRTHKFLGVADA